MKSSYSICNNQNNSWSYVFKIRRTYTSCNRPLVYPMAKGAAERDGKLTRELDEELKGLANSMENYGNFYGQNIFIASSNYC